MPEHACIVAIGTGARGPELPRPAFRPGLPGVWGWAAGPRGGWASLSAGLARHGPASADSPRGAHDLHPERQRIGLCFGQRDASALARIFHTFEPGARASCPLTRSERSKRARCPRAGLLAFGAGREILGLARAGRQPAFLYAPQAPRPPPCRLTVAFHAHKRAGPRNPPRPPRHPPVL